LKIVIIGIKYIVVFIKLLHISGELKFLCQIFFRHCLPFSSWVALPIMQKWVGYIKFLSNVCTHRHDIFFSILMVWLWRVPFSILLHCVLWYIFGSEISDKWTKYRLVNVRCLMGCISSFSIFIRDNSNISFVGVGSLNWIYRGLFSFKQSSSKKFSWEWIHFYPSTKLHHVDHHHHPLTTKILFIQSIRCILREWKSLESIF
jgi:hypothetical protein